MPLGIDPKIDFAFKLVFGSPDHTRITIHFLNAVLNLPQPITWVEILNPIQGKRNLVFNEDLVFHTLELPKYDPGGHNIKELVPLEKWLYFLKNAEHLEADELAEQLVDDEFREAAGVLEMISKSPEDRQFYEARMKFLHDEQARLIAAREEGLAEGMAKGREKGREEGAVHGTLIGKVQMLQEIIGDTVTSATDLLQRSSDELSKLLSELQDRLGAARRLIVLSPVGEEEQMPQPFDR